MGDSAESNLPCMPCQAPRCCPSRNAEEAPAETAIAESGQTVAVIAVQVLFFRARSQVAGRQRPLLPYLAIQGPEWCQILSIRSSASIAESSALSSEAKMPLVIGISAH